jgi:hypothetical protein
MLPEWIQMWSWWLLCRSEDMIYFAAIYYLLWYACIKEWKTQTTVFPSYRNMRTYLKLSTTPEVIWQHQLAYRVNMSKLENYVLLLRQVVHCPVHTSQFIIGSHLISADENVRLNHKRHDSFDASLERRHEKCNYSHYYYYYHESSSSNVTVMRMKAVRERSWPSKGLCLIRIMKCK